MPPPVRLKFKTHRHPRFGTFSIFWTIPKNGVRYVKNAATILAFSKIAQNA